MLLNNLEIKKNILLEILDFSLNIDKYKKSGTFSQNQIHEMIHVAIEINNLINQIDKPATDGIKKPDLEITDLKKIQRVLDLVLRYKSDLNSIAIDMGESLPSTNRFLQKGLDYIFDNLKSKDFKYISQFSPEQNVAPREASRSAAKPKAKNKKKAAKSNLSLGSGLLFMLILGGLGMFIYNFVFNQSATQVTSLVQEYRADRKLTQIAKQVDQISSLKIFGSGALISFFSEMEKSFKLKYPKIPVEFKKQDSSDAINQVINKEIHLACTSRILSVAERKKALKLGNPITDHKIALDAIAVFVHPENPLEKLDLKDLEKIYSGEIVNWQAFSNQDLEIKKYANSPQSGTHQFFQSRVMMGSNLDQSVIKIFVTKQMIDFVANDKSGIGFASYSDVKDKPVKIIKIGSIFNESGTSPEFDQDVNVTAIRRGEYPLTRYLYLVSSQEIIDPVAKFIDYARDEEGQSFLGKLGLISIY